MESPPIKAGTYQVKIDVAEGDPFTAIENLTDPSWTFTITPVPPKPEIPGDSATTPEDGDSEGSKNPSHPAEAPGKDNQNGAAADQESSLDIAKTGDNVTCFTLSTLSLATLSFGALMRSKIRNKKSD